MFEIKIDADIFVWRVSQGARITAPSRRHREFKEVDKGITGAGTSDQRRNLHRLSENRCGGIDRQFDEGVVWIGARRRLAAQVIHLHILETLGIQVSAQLLYHHFGGLVGHQTEIHFGRSTRRQDSLRARPLIA